MRIPTSFLALFATLAFAGVVTAQRHQHLQRIWF